MKITHLLAPAATGAALVAAALALAPAASATAHHTSTSSRSSTLPAASKVFPTPGEQVTITPGSTSTSPSGASLDWTIPACRGTVYASSILKQGSNVYLHERGSSTAYACQSSPQTVTVTYSPADPSQGPLTTGRVKVTTTTHSAPVNGKAYKTRTTSVTSVMGPSAGTGTATLPAASQVFPAPGKQVTINAGGGASLDWTIPACHGTVYAAFLLKQGDAVYRNNGGSANAYTCQSTPQTVTITYSRADPSQGALTVSPVSVSATTKPKGTGPDTYESRSFTLPSVSGVSGLPAASTVVPRFAQGVALHRDSSSSNGVKGYARWIIPACTGTVHATFGLLQDGDTSARATQEGTSDFPCSAADQTLTIAYLPAGPGAPALHAGAVTALVDTHAGSTSSGAGELIKRTTFAEQASQPV